MRGQHQPDNNKTSTRGAKASAKGRAKAAKNATKRAASASNGHDKSAESQKHGSILDFSREQLATALGGEIDAKGDIRAPYDCWHDGRHYGWKGVIIIVGFDDSAMSPLERHYGFNINFEGYGHWTSKPNWHEGLRHILNTLAERLCLEIQPPEEKLEAPELTPEERMAECVARNKAREEASAIEAEAEEKAKKAKREEWCREAGIDIELNAKIEGLDEDAVLANEEACLADIRDKLGYGPDEIIRDGQFHYFSTYATGAGGAGWYIYRDDPQRPWASFGDRREGNKFVWKGSSVKLTPEQLEAWEKRHAADLLIAEKEREEAWEEAAKKARSEWSGLPDANDNNYYLLKKKVGAYGLRTCLCRPIGGIYDLQTLVVPVRNSKGEIISLHFIGAGEKWFKPGCAVKGGYHAIGPKITGKLVIVEGYATGASVYEMTGLPVAIAFDAANMVDVARMLRAKYPEVEIILAGDDDLFTEQTQGINTGKLKAEEAAEAVGGVALFPPFNAKELKGEKSDPTDWNDFVALHGKEAAGSCFTSLREDWKQRQKELEEGPEEATSRYSEAALANLLDAKYGARIRYVAGWGKWFIYNGKVWKEDQTNRVFSYARKICAHVALPLNGGNKTEQTMGRRLNSAQCISAAQSLPRIAATMEQWDADPWLLNTPKGVVDLRTGHMRPHAPEDYMTKSTRVSPGGSCPRFLKFLDEVTNNDEEMVAYLRRKDGYSLTGVTTEHAVFFTYGDGRNGKTVKQNTTGFVLGDYCVAAPITTFIVTNYEQHPTDLAMLRGARLVRCSEVAKGQRWAEEKIKQMSGGDPITARFMRQDFFTYTPQFKLDFLGNVKPSLRTVDEAAKARFQMIPFTVFFEEEKRDHELEERLREEGPGILQWMIDGCLEWQRVGLKPPPKVVAATEEYLRQQDATEEWLRECCERNAPKASTITRLMLSWTQWAEAAGEFVGRRGDLVERLKAKGFEECKTSDGMCLRGLHVARDIPPSFAGAGGAANGNGAVKGNPANSDALNGNGTVVKGEGFTMKKE
jgi:P4 family phage/plasmid primase-like protien